MCCPLADRNWRVLTLPGGPLTHLAARHVRPTATPVDTRLVPIYQMYSEIDWVGFYVVSTRYLTFIDHLVDPVI